MRILAKDTLAVIVDFQEKLMPVIDENDIVVKNTSILIKGLRELGVPIIVTQEYTKGLGSTVEDINKLVFENEVLEKITFSGYENEEIKKAIDTLGKHNIIICGAEAHICVLQTLIDLQNSGYNVILLEDCIGSRKKIDKDCAIKRGIYEGAVISTYEAILFELTRVGGTTQFKNISKLIK